MLSLPTTWTYEDGLPPETGIPGFRDSAVPVNGRTGEDTVYPSTARYKLEEPVSGVQGLVYAITPPAESVDQPVIQGAFFFISPMGKSVI